MNDRMEQEIRRTILRLQASMPEPRDRQTPVFTLLRIAAGEINAGLLLGLFAGALIFGLLSVRALSMPMLTIFCTAPMPMLLLFHRYVLACNERMRELEATFPYSYPEMLAARSVVISCCMFGALLLLSVTLHVSAGEELLRLALCGAVPGIYLCTLLLFLSASDFAIWKGCPCLRSSSGQRSAFWRRCFRLTGFCSSAPPPPTPRWRP